MMVATRDDPNYKQVKHVFVTIRLFSHLMGL